LADIRQRLIELDIRSAVIYRSSSSASRENVIGDIYGKLIDNELKNSLGAIYTPDATVEFMANLGKRFLGKLRGNTILEPACGSGHFYRRLYRDYVDEIVVDQRSSGHRADYIAAHREALERVFGRDIDPFAVQLTLLGTFLEQLRDNVKPSEETQTGELWAANYSVDTQNSLDPITIDPGYYFDIEKTLDLHHAVSRRRSCERASNPSLIIGNPPYGVSVVLGAHYKDVYDLGSHDSYGYFIVNALKRLPDGKRVIFIVSSSFLTILSHRDLRTEILGSAKIIRIVKLHRATFPGIDIFPVVIELEKCGNAASRDTNFYKFYDLWQLHPTNDEEELRTVYNFILSKDEIAEWPFPRTRTHAYQVRQGVIRHFSRCPIFDAMPSLYEFMRDVFTSPLPVKIVKSRDGSQKKEASVHKVRDREVVKLCKIASVRIGLQSGNNAKFYRVAAGVTGGAVKGGYQEIRPENVVSDARLASMTLDEKQNGIQVDDPNHDAYYVPLDKSGEADIEGGVLSMFYRPVDYYVDWSENAVSEMRKLKGARFQNVDFYFRKGISFSSTGLYSPTFRLGHGGVMDQKSPCIFSDVMDLDFLLGILASTLTKYFTKAFINHGVDTQLDDLPIVLPTEHQRTAIAGKVAEIVAEQKTVPAYDYRPKLRELDELVFDLYALTKPERTDVLEWYKRRYPALHRESA